MVGFLVHVIIFVLITVWWLVPTSSDQLLKLERIGKAAKVMWPVVDEDPVGACVKEFNSCNGFKVAEEMPQQWEWT